MTYIAVLLAIGIAVAYRLGIRDGLAVKNRGELPTPPPKAVKREITNEDIIRSNIERYNGDAEGQVELNV